MSDDQQESAPDAPQEIEFVFPPPFVAQLEDKFDDKKVLTAEASEATFQFQGDAIVLDIDGTHVHLTEQQNGRFEFGSEVVTKASVFEVRREGLHNNPVVWQAKGLGQPLTPGVAGTVQLDSRLRFSFFDFNCSFVKKVHTGDRKSPGGHPLANAYDLDLDQIKAFSAARFDDYTFVEGIGFTDADGGDAHPPNWRGFAPSPLVEDAGKEDYLRKLCDALHGLNPRMQVIVGYEMVITPVMTNSLPLRDKFQQWLQAANETQVRAHVDQIRDFFISRNIEIDGIAYDFEMDRLGMLDPAHETLNFTNHAANLKTLFQATAEAYGVGNGFGCVYYTGPMQPDDGTGVSKNMRVVKFAIAKGKGNLVPRPMCFTGTAVTSEKDMLASIKAALRQDATGGSLHPSQLQFALNPGMIGFDKLTKEIQGIFRPNRVGIAVFKPQSMTMNDFVKAAAKWEQALNPNMPGPATRGQPLQVPSP